MSQFPFEIRKKINTNQLINRGGPKLTLEKFTLLKQLFSSAEAKKFAIEKGDSNSSYFENLSRLSEEEIKQIHSKYGEEGLFKLNFLLISHNTADFKHFHDVIRGDLVFSNLLDEEEAINLDNKTLRQNKKLNKFNTNVFQPSFSRKIYNPGRHHGYLVYGVGGPRILVSHPFQGVLVRQKHMIYIITQSM